MTDILRALKIKSGTVKRLSRDVTYAQEESASERTRLQKLTSSGGDEYEVRAQEKVIKDADQMVPDYRSRLKSAIEDLESLIVMLKGTT